MHHLRGFVYWLLTSGPIGTVTGWMLRHRCFDRLGRVQLPEMSKPEIVGAIIFGVYEYPERVLISRWLPRDLDCVELGSSIGIVSRVILRKLAVNRKLFAVEASAVLLDLAKRNVAAAGFAERFKSILGAVHYNGDHVIFEQHEEHIRGKVAPGAVIDGTAIPCITLGRVIKSNTLGMYSLVMDIEGSEFDVIAKDSESLVNCQAIIAEVHGDAKSKDGFAENIERMGFKLVEVKHSVFAFIRR